MCEQFICRKCIKQCQTISDMLEHYMCKIYNNVCENNQRPLLLYRTKELIKYDAIDIPLILHQATIIQIRRHIAE